MELKIGLGLGSPIAAVLAPPTPPADTFLLVDTQGFYIQYSADPLDALAWE